MKNLTGCVEDFALTSCEDITDPVLLMTACNVFKVGFSGGVQATMERFAACTASGDFDLKKFAALMKPFLEDMGSHGARR
jgi:hypothetical protein